MISPLSSSIRFVAATLVLWLATGLQQQQPQNLQQLLPDVTFYKTPLRSTDPLSVWCYTANVADLIGSVWGRSTHNYLATQLWPSARVASMVLDAHTDQDQHDPSPSSPPRPLRNYSRDRDHDQDDDHDHDHGVWKDVHVVCEVGCGPGLPSLTAWARHKHVRVVATDVDPMALAMVRAAADEQASSSADASRLVTCVFDLTKGTGHDGAQEKDAASLQLPPAELYVMSDVFESSAVAIGAAYHARKAIESGSSVWVFAQSDRAQRDLFLDRMRILNDDPSLNWSSLEDLPTSARAQPLFLCNVEETLVPYT